MKSSKERNGWITFSVVAVISIIVTIWTVTRPPGNAGYVWSVRNDVLELQRRVDRTHLSADDITWLIERDNITVIYALIDYAWLGLTSEHLEQLFSKRLSFSGYRGTTRYNITQTGANFSSAMNRVGMTERQLMILANNLRTGMGISGKDARHLILWSDNVTPATFKIAVVQLRYNNRFISSGDWRRCSLCDGLFGRAFERMMNSREFRELPLINERDYMQSQYGILSHIISLRNRPYLPPEPIWYWLRVNRNRGNIGQVTSVVEWYEWWYGDF